MGEIRLGEMGLGEMGQNRSAHTYLMSPNVQETYFNYIVREAAILRLCDTT